jgi:hypothetical protein
LIEPNSSGVIASTFFCSAALRAPRPSSCKYECWKIQPVLHYKFLPCYRSQLLKWPRCFNFISTNWKVLPLLLRLRLGSDHKITKKALILGYLKRGRVGRVFGTFWLRLKHNRPT